MIEDSVVLGYAQALYEIAADKGIADQVGCELEELTALVAGNKDLERLLFHPTVSADKKKKLFENLLSEDSSDLIKRFFYLLVDKRRERLVTVLSSSYRVISRKVKGIVVANVQSTIVMTDDNLSDLKLKLEKLLSKTVEIEAEINPKILGGLVIRIGDKLFDGSVRSKLSGLKKKLMQTVPA